MVSKREGNITKKQLAGIDDVIQKVMLKDRCCTIHLLLSLQKCLVFVILKLEYLLEMF